MYRSIKPKVAAEVKDVEERKEVRNRVMQPPIPGHTESLRTGQSVQILSQSNDESVTAVQNAIQSNGQLLNQINGGQNFVQMVSQTNGTNSVQMANQSNNVQNVVQPGNTGGQAVILHIGQPTSGQVVGRGIIQPTSSQMIPSSLIVQMSDNLSTATEGGSRLVGSTLQSSAQAAQQRPLGSGRIHPPRPQPIPQTFRPQIEQWSSSTSVTPPQIPKPKAMSSQNPSIIGTKDVSAQRSLETAVQDLDAATSSRFSPSALIKTSPVSSVKVEGSESMGETFSPSKRMKGASSRSATALADDIAHSPAYSDISDANENAPMLEKEAEGLPEDDTPHGCGPSAGSAGERLSSSTTYAHDAYSYSPHYNSQPPYLTPAVPANVAALPLHDSISKLIAKPEDFIVEIEKPKSDEKRAGTFTSIAKIVNEPSLTRKTEQPSSRDAKVGAVQSVGNVGGQQMASKSKGGESSAPYQQQASLQNLQSSSQQQRQQQQVMMMQMQMFDHPFQPYLSANPTAPPGFPYVDPNYATGAQPWIRQQQQMQQQLQLQQQHEMKRPQEQASIKPSTGKPHSNQGSSGGTSKGQTLPTPPSLIPDRARQARESEERSAMRNLQKENVESKNPPSDATTLPGGLTTPKIELSPTTGDARIMSERSDIHRYYLPQQQPPQGYEQLQRVAATDSQRLASGDQTRHSGDSSIGGGSKPSAVVAPQSRSVSSIVAGHNSSPHSRGYEHNSAGNRAPSTDPNASAAGRGILAASPGIRGHDLSRGHEGGVHHRGDEPQQKMSSSSGHKSSSSSNYRDSTASSSRSKDPSSKDSGNRNFSNNIIAKDDGVRILVGPQQVPVSVGLPSGIPGSYPYFGHYMPAPQYNTGSFDPAAMYSNMNSMIGYAAGPPGFIPATMMASGPIMLSPGGTGGGGPIDGKGPISHSAGAQLSPYFCGLGSGTADVGGAQMHKIHELKDVAKGPGTGGGSGGSISGESGMLPSPGGTDIAGRPESRGSVHSSGGGLSKDHEHDHGSPPTQRHLHTHHHMHVLGPSLYPVFSNDSKFYNK